MPGRDDKQSRTQRLDADEERTTAVGDRSASHDAVRPLLPEEAVVGSDDADAQARAILADSEDRVNDPAAGIGPDDQEHVHRRSEDTV